MDAGSIAALAELGGLILYSVVATLVAGALWRRLNAVQDKMDKYVEQSNRESREMHAKSLEHAAATQLTIQANTQAIQALERASERRQ